MGSKCCVKKEYGLGSYAVSCNPETVTQDWDNAIQDAFDRLKVLVTEGGDDHRYYSAYAGCFLASRQDIQENENLGNLRYRLPSGDLFVVFSGPYAVFTGKFHEWSPWKKQN